MKDVHGVNDARHVNDAVGVPVRPDADLPAAGSDRRHRLLIGRIEAHLDQVQLIASTLASGDGEAPQVISGAADEHHVLQARSIQDLV